LGQAKRLGDGMERGDAYREGQTKLKYNALWSLKHNVPSSK
jgi:hypothetical protein